MNIIPFSANSRTTSVAATPAASGSAALPGSGNTIRIVNEGPNIAFIAIGTGAQTAALPTTGTAGATPCPVGDVTLTIASDQIYNFSLICRAAGSAQVNIQVGEGA